MSVARHTNCLKHFPGTAITLLFAASWVPWNLAEVRLPAIFGDHMVLQQNQRDRIWGWADPDEAITVSIERQSRSTQADKGGRWLVELDPLPAGGPHTLTVKGTNVVSFSVAARMLTEYLSSTPA